MKLFSIKVLLFTGLLLGLGLILHFALPEEKYWGNKEYARKIQMFSDGKYNTVFFGSSRVLTGINPILFDSLLNDKRPGQYKSFNLATPGTWANETFYLYEEFLNDAQLRGGVKVVFMEFQNIMAIRPDKLASSKVVYYQSGRNLSFISRYAWDEMRMGIRNAPSSAYTELTCLFATAENLLNVGRFSFNKSNVDSLSYFGIDGRGYLGLNPGKRLVKNRNASATEIEAYRSNVSARLHKTYLRLNKAFNGKINELIQRSKEKGIHLIFVLPPVKLTDGMVALFQALPDANKIELCDPEKFPPLYDVSNWIDETHLSADGSRLLTGFVARDFVKQEGP